MSLISIVKCKLCHTNYVIDKLKNLCFTGVKLNWGGNTSLQTSKVNNLPVKEDISLLD